MSEVGLAAYEGSGEDRSLGYELGQQRPYSEATAQRIDGAVHEILDQRHRQVLELLEQARTRLTRLAESLLEHETLGQDELVRLLGPRPAAGARDARSNAQGNERSARAARRG